MRGDPILPWACPCHQALSLRGGWVGGGLGVQPAAQLLTRSLTLPVGRLICLCRVPAADGARDNPPCAGALLPGAPHTHRGEGVALSLMMVVPSLSPHSASSEV